MVRSLKILRIQLLVIILFAILASIAAIIHGIFIDLDISQLKRLTFESFLITLIIAVPAIILLEWIFDINNRRRFDHTDKKIQRLEEKIKKLEKLKR